MCPADVHLTDGVPCGNSTTLKCASGQCTSRDGQCQLRGGRMNISQACSYNSNTCQLNCLDPTDSSQCVILTGLFLNGTACGYGGYCQGGTCTNSSLSKYVPNIDSSHLNLTTNQQQMQPQAGLIATKALQFLYLFFLLYSSCLSCFNLESTKPEPFNEGESLLGQSSSLQNPLRAGQPRTLRKL
jgi:hypothetical protein